jgi:hypothetical protein
MKVSTTQKRGSIKRVIKTDRSVLFYTELSIKMSMKCSRRNFNNTVHVHMKTKCDASPAAYKVFLKLWFVYRNKSMELFSVIGESEESVYAFRSMFTGKSNIHIPAKLVVRYVKNISHYTFVLLFYILCL